VTMIRRDLNNDLKRRITLQPHPTDEVFLCSKKGVQSV